MKRIFKISALLLALLMIVPVIVACNFNNNAGDETESETVIETDEWGQAVVNDGIPEDLDYGGKTVNILIRGGQQYRREWIPDTEKEELDALDQEIVKRNQAVSKRIGVTLNYIPYSKSETLNEPVQAAGKNGTGEYDIVSNYAANATSTNILQYYMNFNNDVFTYMDLSKPYWNQNFIKDAEAFGKLYVCVGDANLSVYDRAFVVFFNKAKAETYLSDINLYQMVLEKKWTYNEFYKIIANIHDDNGTVETTDDFYGVSSIKGSEAFDGFLYSLGANMTQKDESGNHSLVTDSAYTRLGNAFTMVYDFWSADGAWVNPGNSMANYEFFTKGGCLFDIDVMYHYESGNNMLRNMVDGYGIVPMPMYDENQGGYQVGVQDAHNVMSVVNHFKQDYEMISAVLECLNSISYSTVRPYYIEKIVKGQFLDNDSNSVFGIILEGTRWDFADVYNTACGGIREKIWRSPLRKQADSTIDTAYSTNVESFNGNIATIDEWLRIHW